MTHTKAKAVLPKVWQLIIDILRARQREVNHEKWGAKKGAGPLFFRVGGLAPPAPSPPFLRICSYSDYCFELMVITTLFVLSFFMLCYTITVTSSLTFLDIIDLD